MFPLLGYFASDHLLLTPPTGRRACINAARPRHFPSLDDNPFPTASTSFNILSYPTHQILALPRLPQSYFVPSSTSPRRSLLVTLSLMRRLLLLQCGREIRIPTPQSHRRLVRRWLDVRSDCLTRVELPIGTRHRRRKPPSLALHIFLGWIRKESTGLAVCHFRHWRAFGVHVVGGWYRCVPWSVVLGIRCGAWMW